MNQQIDLEKYRIEGLWKSFSEKLQFDTKDMERRPELYETVKQAFTYGVLTLYAQVILGHELYKDEQAYMKVLDNIHKDGEVFLKQQEIKKMIKEN